MEALRRFTRFCKEFNLFATDATDIESIQTQRWSTLVYIVLLLCGVYILLLSHVLQVEIQLVEVKNPSFESYLKLYELHGNITCFCSEISSSYRSFVKVGLIYDSVCSSDFVSQTWIEMLVDNMTTQRFVGDFRAVVSLQFQVLQELCNRSKSFLNMNVEAFYDTQYIANYLVNEHLLRIDTEIVIGEVLTKSYTTFNQSISFLRSFMKGNLLVSGIGTTAITGIELWDAEYRFVIAARVYTSVQYLDGCMCDNSDQCSVPSVFYNSAMVDDQPAIVYWENETNVSFAMKNWLVGCWALNSLLMSSYEDSFLYNQTTLNLIATYFHWSSNSILPSILNLSELNLRNESRNTFYDLLQNLFVQQSSIEIDYSLYYSQCQPQLCQYSIKQKPSFLLVFTSFLSLYGGLSVPLRFLIPYIVASLIRRSRQRNQASINMGKFEERILAAKTH